MRTDPEFEVLTFSKSYLRDVDSFVREKIKDFETETLIFDHAHLVALSGAETALALLEERAMRDGGAEWRVMLPYTAVGVKNTKRSHLLFSYRVGEKRSTRSKAKAILALNEFFNAERRINPSFEVPRKASRRGA